MVKMSARHRRVCVALALIGPMSAACRQARESSPVSSPAESIAIEPMGIQVAAACYRSPHSVLFGPPTPSGQQGKGPGWLGLELSLHGDSGLAKLVDPGSKAFYASWRRDATDSVALAAADDFLRVEMRLALLDSLVIGSASARSDAALERDQSGRLAELRRQWTIRAVRAPCDSMPAGWKP